MKRTDRDSGLAFELDEKSPVSYADQLVAAIRQAIQRRELRVGDRLPTWKDLAKRLGVSARIPRDATARLVREGLLVTRGRLGTFIASSVVRRQPKRTVLVVLPDCESANFSAECLVDGLRQVLNRYACSLVKVGIGKGRGGRAFDFSIADRMLSFGADFIFVASGDMRFVRWAAQKGVPFATLPPAMDVSSPNFVGSFPRFDFTAAVKDLAAHFKKAGVRSCRVVEFGRPPLFDAKPTLAAAGISVEQQGFSWEFSSSAEVREQAMRHFTEQLRRGRGGLPDAFLFTDDYVAAGAILAFLHAGIRVPDDVRLVAFANVGNEPSSPMPVSFIAADSRERGCLLARSILDYLGGKPFVPRIACAHLVLNNQIQKEARSC